ncbi:MAG TPA: hypothetical protein VFE98_09695 [Candidatus Bathyarchaeia archaeon]|nr:hypothetical protein [Candidatus Bathyarchaeia archaeon]
MDAIKYPSLEQVERAHNRILELTGGERGDLSRSNLEYALEAVKGIGEKLEHRQVCLPELWKGSAVRGFAD